MQLGSWDTQHERWREGPVHKKSSAFRQRICFPPLQQRRSEQRSIKTFSSLSPRRYSREQCLHPPFWGVEGVGTSRMVNWRTDSWGEYTDQAYLSRELMSCCLEQIFSTVDEDIDDREENWTSCLTIVQYFWHSTEAHFCLPPACLISARSDACCPASLRALQNKLDIVFFLLIFIILGLVGTTTCIPVT